MVVVYLLIRLGKHVSKIRFDWGLTATGHRSRAFFNLKSGLGQGHMAAFMTR